MKLSTLSPLSPPPQPSDALRRSADPIPKPALLAWVEGPGAEGIETPWRLAGITILPASTLLGLRAFEDAYEDQLPGEAPDGSDCMRVIFDLEKLLRMALHQSVLALELLASPAPLQLHAPFNELAPVELAQAAITSGVIRAYRGVLPSTLDAIDAGERMAALSGLRRLYTASLLHRDAVMGTDLGAQLLSCAPSPIAPIVEGWSDGPLRPAQARALKDEARRLDALLDLPGALPERPHDYDLLHETLVAWRLATS
ncbi:hypothetical protein EA187_15575 [Lujinxingia sediminis]|uniref:Nucleotidyltransferase n=1 Tax=Lujinxingia sediminis TaxID=2480984 RepID=A0ABY0CRA8_9DELT|nr:nucleotidyltransferase domain-containing protein [Lujinxingia sediminis]RVU42606.1 hypothetical protein EA187_15575 [Lujinxingia sediminis]